MRLSHDVTSSLITFANFKCVISRVVTITSSWTIFSISFRTGLPYSEGVANCVHGTLLFSSCCKETCSYDLADVN